MMELTLKLEATPRYLDASDALALRQEQAVPILKAIKEWMVAGGRASTHELETRATALVHDLTERLK